MVGSELAGYADYLLDRAKSDLGVRAGLGPFFQTLAPAFVAVFGIPEVGLHLRVGHVMRNLPADVGDVVDIGCGAGMMLGQIHARRQHGVLAGVEKDPASCAVARRAHPYAQLFEDDILSTSGRLAGAFDFALVLDVLQYVPEHLLDGFVRSCARTLKPGGRLILHAPLLEDSPRRGRFTDWTQPGWMRQGFSGSALATLMRSNGLVPLSICKTVNTIAAQAWEWNMLIAGRPMQSLAFPLLLLLATIGEGLPSRHHSCVLCVATQA